MSFAKAHAMQLKEIFMWRLRKAKGVEKGRRPFSCKKCAQNRYCVTATTRRYRAETQTGRPIRLPGSSVCTLLHIMKIAQVQLGCYSKDQERQQQPSSSCLQPVQQYRWWFLYCLLSRGNSAI